MTKQIRYLILAATLLWRTVSALSGQTNCAAEFQGFRPGDLVRVQSQKPLIVLGNAVFQSQTETNIVVYSRGDRYVLNKTGVALSVPEKFATLLASQSRTAPGEPTEARVELGKQDAQLLMLGVQQKVLGSFQQDPGYAKANEFYQRTVNGFLEGKLGLADIVDQAEKTLREVEDYRPDRAKDPQFEGQIEFLKDFVKRAKGGEKVFGTSRLE